MFDRNGYLKYNDVNTIFILGFYYNYSILLGMPYNYDFINAQDICPSVILTT